MKNGLDWVKKRGRDVKGAGKREGERRIKEWEGISALQQPTNSKKISTDDLKEGLSGC